MFRVVESISIPSFLVVFVIFSGMDLLGVGGGAVHPSPGQRGAIFHDKAKKKLDLETK